MGTFTQFVEDFQNSSLLVGLIRDIFKVEPYAKPGEINFHKDGFGFTVRLATDRGGYILVQKGPDASFESESSLRPRLKAFMDAASKEGFTLNVGAPGAGGKNW